MIFSEEYKDLFAALIKAEGELKNVEKAGENPHFKSTYVTLDSIIKEVRPVLAKFNLAVIQDVTSGENSISVTTMIIHETGQWLKHEGLKIQLAKMDAQSIGSAVTYARRYTLLAILNLVGTDDDDDGNKAVGDGKEDEAFPKGKIENLLKAIKEATSLPGLQSKLEVAKKRTWTDEETKLINEAAEARKNEIAQKPEGNEAENAAK